MPTSGKNRKYLCIQKKKLKTSLKTGFAQISLPAQKPRVTQNFGGAAAPLVPAARTPIWSKSNPLNIFRNRRDFFKIGEYHLNISQLRLVHTQSHDPFKPMAC